MRLYEILNTDYRDTEFKKSKDPEIGKGRYSTVTQKDEYSVDKQYKKKHKDVSQDPYYIYIKAISDDNLASKNPYFPRVYDVESGNIGKDSRPKFNMEKLIPLASLPSEVLYDIGKNIVDLSAYDQNFNFHKERNGSGAKAIVAPLNRAIHQKNFSEIKDTNLRKALQVIINIRVKHDNFNPDIGVDNVMVRLTSAGPQLVLTDPLH